MERRSGRRALIITALLAVVAVLALRSERAGAAVCEALRSELPKHVPFQIDAARCRLEPLGFAVALDDVTVRQGDPGTVVGTVERVEVSLRSVLWSTVTLDEVRLTGPKLRLTVPEGPHAAPGGACFLEPLRRIHVDTLEIERGSVALAGADGLEVTLDGLDVRWSTKRSTVTSTVQVAQGRVVEHGRSHDVGRVWVEGELDLSGATLSLGRAEAAVGGISVSGSGSFEQLCDESPQLAVQGRVYAPLAVLGQLTGLPAGGQLSGRVSVSGRTTAPRVRGEVQGSGLTLGRFTPGDFTAVFSATRDLVELESFVTKAGSGTVKLSGEVKVGSGWPATVRVETENASFARIMERAGQPGVWVEFPASVDTTLTGPLFPKPQLSGEVDARVGRFVLAARAFDAPESAGPTLLTFAQSRAQFRLNVTSERVEFKNVRVGVGEGSGTRVKGEVTLFTNQQRGLEVHVDAESLQLSDFGHIAGLPFSGQGVARVDLSGPYGDVDIAGLLTLRDLVFAGYAPGVVQSPVTYRRGVLSFPAVVGQKGRTGLSGGARLDFQSPGLGIDAWAELSHGRTEDVVALLAPLHPSIAALQGGLTGDARGRVRFLGPAKANHGEVALTLQGTEVYGRRLGDAELALTMEASEALVLAPVEFKGPLGTVSAQGRWAFSGPLGFKVDLRDGSLPELLGRSWAEPLGLGGPATAQLVFEGTAAVPVGRGFVASPKATLGAQVLGPVQLELGLSGRQLEAFGKPFPGAQGKVTLQLKDDFAWQGQLALGLEELTPFLPAKAVQRGVGGSLRGLVQLSGTLPNVSNTELRAQLGELVLHRGDLALRNDGPVVVDWKRGRMEIAALSLKGPGTRLELAGSYGPTEAALEADGAFDLRFAEPFLPGVERASGQLEVSAALNGPVGAPAMAGSVRLADAALHLRESGLTLKAANGSAEFSQERVLLHELKGFLNDGKLSARGDVTLEKGAVAHAEVGIDLEEVGYAVRPELPAVLTGALLFYGKPEHWQLGGSLDVVRLKYTRSFTLETLLQEAAAPRLLPSGEKATPWLALDLDLDATRGDVRLENSLARARLVGKLKVTGTNAEPVLSGALEAADGAQAFFRSHTFQVNRGVVTFTRNQPTVELTATTQVREYQVGVKAFGSLADPKVHFTSEPSLPESDVLSLITLGVTSRERLATQAGFGLAGEALLSATGLEREVQRFLKKNVGLKDQKVQLSTSFNEATGQAEPSVSWEAKVGTEKLTVGVTQPVTGRGTKAQAEYRFNPRVSARAQWDNQSQDSSVGNPGVDLKFRFEWE